MALCSRVQPHLAERLELSREHRRAARPPAQHRVVPLEHGPRIEAAGHKLGVAQGSAPRCSQARGDTAGGVRMKSASAGVND